MEEIPFICFTSLCRDIPAIEKREEGCEWHSEADQ